MRETNKAKRAFEDYFAMGPGRSIRKLHERYCRQKDAEASPNPPTARLRTLKTWSAEHNWQDRVAEREKRIADERYEAIIEGSREAGYAFWPKRVEDLNELAQTMFRNLKAVAGTGGFLAALKEYRALLSDIAAEMGERRKGMELSGPRGGPIEIEDIEATRKRRWEEVAELIESAIDLEEESADE